MQEWQGKKVGILGWGVDTQDVEPWLREQGAEITILDEKDKPFGDLSQFDVLVRSPGVKLSRLTGLNVTSKIKIFFDVCPCPIIGVTGTKGKGTTATLIYEILKEAGKDVYVGGNIGHGIFKHLSKLTKDSIMVLELSSFQLIDLHKSPHIAVVLMTTSEHLNWHADDQEYVKAKSTITQFQTPNDWAVYNQDYPNSVKIGNLGQGQKMAVSGKNWSGYMQLRGEHNLENVVAAEAVGIILDVPHAVINKVIGEFKGLEHRLEEVAVKDGVMYFDDSFATTPETTIAAIKAFTEPLILIVGGSDKGSDFRELGKTIDEAKNIKAVILIGQMASNIEQVITNKNVQLIKELKTMPEIVKKASEMATSGDVVLLSPACASYDMFKSYKDRGDQFKTEVRKLLN